jgi:two-component system cell cycle sensor histidine kinase/response regulator CckA
MTERMRGLKVLKSRAEVKPSLLVEGDEMPCRATKAILEALGYAVTAAASPAEALALLKTKEATFDLFLTDVVMPGMNGAYMWD